MHSEQWTDLDITKFVQKLNAIVFECPRSIYRYEQNTDSP